MADSILRLKVESSEYDSKIRRATEGLKRYADGCRQAGRTLNDVDNGVLEFTQALGKMDTVSRDARGKINELTKSFTDLKLQYNQLTQEEKNSPFGQALSSSLDQLKTRIADGKSELAGINQELNGSTNILDALSSKFGVNIQQIAGWGSAIGAAAGAFKVMKDAFFASEQNLDDWNRTVYSAQSTYEAFLTSLNTGDVSGFLDNIDVIIGAARDAYNAIDRLQTMQNIQSPKMSAKMAEVQRMETMLRTGRYIAPVDGRKPAMAEGTILTDAQKKRIADNLASAMREIASLTKNEVKASTDAINALYREQALRLGMSNKQFMEGTKSMAAFEDNLEKAQKYSEFEARHTTYQLTSMGNGEFENRPYRDNAVNPYEKYKGWAVFKDDGELYQQIIQMISQRSASESGYYGQLARAYRGINRAEGISPYGGGTSGSSKTTTITEKELTIQQQISKLETEAYTATEERRKEISKQVQELDKELAKQKEIRDQLHGIKKEQEAILPQIVQGTNIQTQEGLNAYLSMLIQQRGGTVYGSAAYNNLTGQIVDMTTLKNLLNESMKTGLGTALFDIADETGRDFWTRAMEGGVENIDWQSIVDKINEQRKAAGLDAIKLDFVTGGINGEKSPATSTGASNGKGDFNKLVGNVSTITGALNQLGVEIPEGFSKTLGVLQVISTITMAIQSLVGLTASTSILKSIPIIGWFLHNGGVVHAANGFSGEVPGNMFSGDNIPAMLDSGETVLSRAQAGILASALNTQTYSGTGRSEAVIESDQIRLVLQNGAQAQGKTLGEYLNI